MVLLTGSLYAEIRVMAGLVDLREQQMVAGRGIVVVGDVPSHQSALMDRACQQLSSYTGLVGVGRVAAPRSAQIRTYPGQIIRTAEVDYGAWQMFFGSRQPPHDGFAVGSELVDRLGLVGGDPLLFEDGTKTHVEVELDTPRPVAPSAGWLFEVGSHLTETDECWIEFPTAVGDVETGVIRAAFSNVDQLQIRPFLRETSLTRNPEAEMRSRWSRWTYPVSILVISVLYILVVSGRRGERAVYVLVGMSRAEEYVLSLIEAFLLTIPSAVVIASAWFVHGRGDQSNELVALAATGGISSVAAMLCILPILAVTQRRDSILTDLRG